MIKNGILILFMAKLDLLYPLGKVVVSAEQSECCPCRSGPYQNVKGLWGEKRRHCLLPESSKLMIWARSLLVSSCPAHVFTPGSI